MNWFLTAMPTSATLTSSSATPNFLHVSTTFNVYFSRNWSRRVRKLNSWKKWNENADHCMCVADMQLRDKKLASYFLDRFASEDQSVHLRAAKCLAYFALGNR